MKIAIHIPKSVSNAKKQLFLSVSILLLFGTNGCCPFRHHIHQDLESFCQRLNSIGLRIAVADSNITNANNTRTPEGGPYKRRIITGCVNGICTITLDETPANQVYYPGHPDADERGFVKFPNININVETYELLKAERDMTTLWQHAPVCLNFFEKDPRGKACMEKYPAIRYWVNRQKGLPLDMKIMSIKP